MSGTGGFRDAVVKCLDVRNLTSLCEALPQKARPVRFEKYTGR
jgi:hypothetical protein